MNLKDIKQFMRDFIGEIDGSPVSTSTDKRAELSLETISQALEEVEKGISRIRPEPGGVLITDLISLGTYRVIYEGKEWLLISRGFWEELLPSFQKVEGETLSALNGIPVFDDEELARKIIFGNLFLIRSWLIEPPDWGSGASS